MNGYIITMKFDYTMYQFFLRARNEKAAVNKAKRIWPNHTFISIKAE